MQRHYGGVDPRLWQVDSRMLRALALTYLYNTVNSREFAPEITGLCWEKLQETLLVYKHRFGESPPTL